MPATDGSGERRAVLFTRDDLPTPARKRRDAVVRTLHASADRGDLDAVEVVDWAKRVPVDAASTERDRHATFRAWADRAGVTLAPSFDTRTCYGTATGRRREELVLPALCLAVYEHGDLATVAPHVDGSRAVSVEDVLERVRSRGPSEDTRAATVPSR